MPQRPLRVGFLGFGAVGAAFAKGLADHNEVSALSATDPMLAHDSYGPSIRGNAESTGVHLVDAACQLPIGDVLFIATPGAATKSALKSLGPTPRSNELIVDVTTAAIEDKNENAKAAEAIGARYVDGAIVGPIPVLGLKAPMLVSGDAAGVFKGLADSLGMVVEIVAGPVGSAVAAKYIRSIFTKGFESLILEMALAAEVLGVKEVVLQGLAKTFNAQTFEEHIDRSLREDAIHSGRRAVEMGNVVQLLSARGLPDHMSRAASTTLSWSASLGTREHFGGVAPEDSVQVIEQIIARAQLSE